LGVWGVWFFAILAPTSSILPGNRQTLAEHRMYLPLAAVVVLAVMGSHRVIACGAGTRAAAGRRILILGTACAVGLGWLTIRRNEDYRTELTLYRDTVAKRPDNAFARYNLGKALAESGAPAEAIAHYEAALRLEPTWAHAHYNLGNALAELGRSGLAAEQFRHALRLKPDYLRARYNLGNMLVQLGDRSAALDEYLAVVRLRPDYAEARDNLGSVLLDLGRTAEAVEQYRQVVALGAAAPETHCNLGVALLLLDRARDALPHFEKALAGNPRLVPAREGMARARAALEK
jgi:tetratricopeptide (TPR) repeat protein